MQLALVLFRYFPHGGLQRDFARFVHALQAENVQCRVYTMSWQGERLANIDLRLLPAAALTNHRRCARFIHRVQEDVTADPVDGVIGFNKMPGLDVYFAADACFVEQARSDHGALYRLTARYRAYAAWERAVFEPEAGTHILCLSPAQAETYTQHYQTPAARLEVLPPGVESALRPREAAVSQHRGRVRAALGLQEQEFTWLFVGSDFHRKGLDRAIVALAKMQDEQPSVLARLLVVGADRKRRYQRLAARLHVAQKVSFLGAREDVIDIMRAADVLVHPARREAGGIVLLEALALGLPVVTTDVCGYAEHVDKGRAGRVLPTPYEESAFEAAVMRLIDGVYRAECARAAELYARLTDLYSKHRVGAQSMIEQVRKVGRSA